MLCYIYILYIMLTIKNVHLYIYIRMCTYIYMCTACTPCINLNQLVSPYIMLYSTRINLSSFSQHDCGGAVLTHLGLVPSSVPGMWKRQYCSSSKGAVSSKAASRPQTQQIGIVGKHASRSSVDHSCSMGASMRRPMASKRLLIWRISAIFSRRRACRTAHCSTIQPTAIKGPGTPRLGCRRLKGSLVLRVHEIQGILDRIWIFFLAYSLSHAITGPAACP